LVGDKGTYLVRGQVILLKAPWVKHLHGIEVVDNVYNIYLSMRRRKRSDDAVHHSLVTVQRK